MTQDEEWLLEEKYDGLKSLAFFADRVRLQAGEPLAYVIGHIPFLHTKIYLDSQPLIPRPETEFWVENAITEIQSMSLPSPKILDLCAGSGCIGIAVAKALPSSIVHFAEIEESHHQTILKNCTENKIDHSRIQICTGNLFENTLPRYDFILSNPPYISTVLDRAQASVKKFEPHVALYSGADGLDLIRLILKQAKEQLTPAGILFIEHEPEHVAELQKLGAEADLSISTHTDQYNVPRYSRFAVAQ